MGHAAIGRSQLSVKRRIIGMWKHAILERKILLVQGRTR